MGAYWSREVPLTGLALETLYASVAKRLKACNFGLSDIVANRSVSLPADLSMDMERVAWSLVHLRAALPTVPYTHCATTLLYALRADPRDDAVLYCVSGDVVVYFHMLLAPATSSRMAVIEEAAQQVRREKRIALGMTS